MMKIRMVILLIVLVAATGFSVGVGAGGTWYGSDYSNQKCRIK